MNPFANLNFSSLPHRKVHKLREYTTVFGFPFETSEEYIGQPRKSTQWGCVPTLYATKAS